MKKASFIFIISLVVLCYLPCLAEDLEYGRIVGDRKYFAVNHTVHTFGRDYIVKNPRATLPQPTDIPLAKMDSTQPFEFLPSGLSLRVEDRVVSKVEPQECEVWTEDQRISYWIYTPYSPRVAVVGDTIHVVWYQRFYSKFTHREVCYVRSMDGGFSWSDSILLSITDGVESIRPEVVAKHNNVYIVWEDLTSMDWGGIYFRKSTDGGTTWQEITPVALRGVDDYDYYCPTIAVRDSEIYVAYNTNDGSEESSLRFKKSVDYGESWEPEVLVSETPEEGHWLKLVSNNEGLHISHGFGFRIYYNRSTDWGDTWTDDIFISDMDGSAAQWPSIGVDDNRGIYISWFDYKYSPYPWTGDIFLRRSTDNGETWDPIMVLTDNHLCIESDVCGDKSLVLVVWRDERHEQNVELYDRRSTDSGFSWGEEERLTDAPNGSVDPRITTNSGKFYLTWLDHRDYPEERGVYFKKGYWYIPGDVNRDRIVDIGDIIFLINYLFMTGTSPDIFESGDVNGDGQIDVGDVVYLINYLFIGGPEPVGC